MGISGTARTSSQPDARTGCRSGNTHAAIFRTASSVLHTRKDTSIRLRATVGEWPDAVVKVAVAFVVGFVLPAALAFSVVALSDETIDLQSCADLEEALQTFEQRPLTPFDAKVRDKLQDWFVRAGCQQCVTNYDLSKPATTCRAGIYESVPRVYSRRTEASIPTSPSPAQASVGRCRSCPRLMAPPTPFFRTSGDLWG